MEISSEQDLGLSFGTRVFGGEGGLHQYVFMAGRLSGSFYVARRRSTRPSTSWSHPLLKAYAKQLDTEVDPKCPSCGEEPQAVEHWLQQLFREPSPPLSVLIANPGSVLALARKTLL